MTEQNQVVLNFDRCDPERRLGLHAGRYTGVNNLLSLGLAILLTGAFYGVLYPLWQTQKFPALDMFFHGGAAQRSVIPYFTIFLAAWCWGILGVKLWKLQVQRKALKLQLVPDDPEFVLTPESAVEILQRMNRQVYGVRNFLLLTRIERALGNLRNLGRVGDFADALAVQSENDEKYLDSTYTLLRGFIWAIPVLGFIGTVLGLSQAVGGFGTVIAAGADFEGLKGALTGVTGGLAVAFETTLIALVAALGIQLVLTMILKKEEEFLDDCNDYCHRNLIAKLRMIDWRDGLE